MRSVSPSLFEVLHKVTIYSVSDQSRNTTVLVDFADSGREHLVGVLYSVVLTSRDLRNNPSPGFVLIVGIKDPLRVDHDVFRGNVEDRNLSSWM